MPKKKHHKKPLPFPAKTKPVSDGIKLIPEMPTINVAIGDIGQLAGRAWKAVVKANSPPLLFAHHMGLVAIEQDPQGLPFIRVLDQDRLCHRVARAATWVKPHKGGTIGAEPPVRVIRDMLVDPRPPLPPLRRLTSYPYFTKSGLLHHELGYLQESAIYYAPRSPLNLLHVPAQPSAEELMLAVETLKRPLCDFKLVGPSSLAHALALTLVPLVQEVIDGPVPLTLINKPMPGCGGGLLMAVLLWPALGGSPPEMTGPTDESEWRRTLYAMLAGDHPVIAIDNVQLRLESAALASALTEPVLFDRVMRTSSAPGVLSRRIWVAVGNSVSLSTEIARRAVTITIDPGVPEPWLLTDFKIPDLRAYVREHRAEFLHAALTICSAWFTAGCPTGKRTLGSFESWAKVMGGILEVAGITGFLEATANAIEPEAEAWVEFIELWWIAFTDHEVGVKDVAGLLQDHEDLRAALGLAVPNADLHARLGKRLSQRQDQMFAGRRLHLVGTSQGANRWQLVPVTEPMAIAAVQIGNTALGGLS